MHIDNIVARCAFQHDTVESCPTAESCYQGNSRKLLPGEHAIASVSPILPLCTFVNETETVYHRHQLLILIIKKIQQSTGARIAQDAVALDVPFTSVVKEYNTFMGGVDKSYQVISYHHMTRQTKKYWNF